MIMKVKDILNYNRIIKNIIDSNTDINALIKFKMLGMLKQFEPVIANYEIVRNDKIKEYGTFTENGNYGIFVPQKDNYDNEDDYQKAIAQYEETFNKFDADMNEIADSESDIKLTKFGAEILDIGIPADYLLALYDLIEMDGGK